MEKSKEKKPATKYAPILANKVDLYKFKKVK